MLTLLSFLFFQLQDSSVVLDTLSRAYSDKWMTNSLESEGLFTSFMNSNNLIFVVLGVTLIIWTVLIVHLTRIDKKISVLENHQNYSSDEA
jgi:uncharacterized membrane protein SpoIIM required for sporulation